MKTFTNYTIIALLALTAACNQKSAKLYVNGEMIAPNWICPDTLIVVNANELNKTLAFMAKVDPSADQLAGVFLKYCVVKMTIR